MKKYYAKATRDFTRTIHLGALVVAGLPNGSNQEIAPPRVTVLNTKADSVAQFRTKARRDAYLAACNAENPGAVVAVQS